MHRSQVSLENISSVEALLSCSPRTWTEAADHGSTVVSKCMSVLVVLSCKSLLVVLTARDRAFFWSLVLMCHHVSLEVLKGLAAVGIWASSLLPGVFIGGVRGSWGSWARPDRADRPLSHWWLVYTKVVKCYRLTEGVVAVCRRCRGGSW